MVRIGLVGRVKTKGPVQAGTVFDLRFLRPSRSQRCLAILQ
jgi:hypothetical protein